ncbi:MAG: matrixin family metalloprotease [Proteobacteria bacterium]|nr:matrixin family metalloprotease [Pseudomonadota bacterium]
MYKLFLATAITLVSFNALGYELRETNDGDPIFFHETEVEIVLDKSLKKLGDVSEVEAAVVDMFDLWVETAGLPIDFTFVHGKCGNDLGYNPDGPNEHCVAASNKEKMWYRSQGNDPGATAIVSYSPTDGEIVDADIVFNVKDWKWSTKGELKGTLNIHAVAAHEIGHLFGLAHSDIGEAVMYPITQLNDHTSPSLHTDDIKAITSLYDNFSEYSEDDDEAVDCEATATAAGGTPSSWIPFALFLAALLWRRLFGYNGIIRPALIRIPRASRYAQKSFHQNGPLQNSLNHPAQCTRSRLP